jgi:AcrR family transcriptional regulator
MSTPARPYRARRRPAGSAGTRERIVAAVRALLEEGAFHEATVEQVADRAGVARATLYQHFGSRLALVDAICDTFAVNPELVRLRAAVGAADPPAALAGTIAQAVRFWDSEDAVLAQLYGVAAVDPAAQDLVDRQRADRRGEVERFARGLRAAGALAEGVSERRAVALLMVLTSYETFRELRAAGLSVRELTRMLQDGARELLLTPASRTRR